MIDSKHAIAVPSFFHRVFSVWFRHYRVYTRFLISNGFPPFVEPLFFLSAIGVGLGSYIETMEGMPYIVFLGSGILVSPAMFTAAFECTYGTFIRLEFDRVYDGMLAASITARDLIIGEILFAGVKAFFFSGAVLFVISFFGIVEFPSALLSPVGGFFTGLMFACVSLLVTSFVYSINHFNFYFTGILTPQLFFSGAVFPLTRLPTALQYFSELLPMTHAVRLVRAMCLNRYSMDLLYDCLYIVAFILIVGFFAIRRLERRLVN